MKKHQIMLCCLWLYASPCLGWGFFAHKHINRLAVFTLPKPMLKFYKHHIQLLTENAVNPDKRRYAVPGESPKHYIDIEHYGDSAFWKIPQYWSAAIALYPKEKLLQHGTLPWHIYQMKHRLTKAFQEKNVVQILKLSADLGHYLADANVPLHTTQNYNGQLAGQVGIHGLWETRLPALFFNQYGFFVGHAEYIHHPQKYAWQAITQAHNAVDSVLRFEKKLSKIFPAVKKYSFEQKGTSLQKVYSMAYAKAYHTMLKGQVERQMQASIKMIGDFWFTCWVDAGQPNLNEFLQKPLNKSCFKEIFPKEKKIQAREYEYRP